MHHKLIISDMIINRLKVILAEKQVSNKSLAEKMNISITTVSRWCTNKTQPSLETLVEIADILNVDIKELIVSTK